MHVLPLARAGTRAGPRVMVSIKISSPFLPIAVVPFGVLAFQDRAGYFRPAEQGEGVRCALF